MFVRTCCALLIATFVASTSMAAPSRNVLLLISDNQNRDDCGCYGNNVVQTPNIDRLANQGVRFLEAFATTASCGPSRAVIYSGLQTHANGQYGHGHGTHTYTLNSKVDTVFKLLQANGYKTALLGKQHTTPESAYPYSYNPGINSRDVTKLAAGAKTFISQSGEKPFFLTIGYSDPHPTSRDRPGWGIRKHYAGVTPINYDPADVIVPSYLPDEPEVREGLAGYYQEISRMDQGIGMVLKVLEESGKADETLVIFTSDHGSSEPGAMGNHYEPGILVPFIVRNPQAAKTGHTNSGLVTLADITPTILDWTKTTGPKYALHGRSLLPILDQQKPKGWDQVCLTHVCHEVTMYYPMRTIRTPTHKLIWNLNWRSEYPLPIDTLWRATWREAVLRGENKIGPRSIDDFLFRDQVELYDLRTDADELNNLADDPAHASLRTELSNKLINWLTETNDEWLVRHRLTLPGQPESISSRQTHFDPPITHSSE